jgi:hypothetical protein
MDLTGSALLVLVGLVYCAVWILRKRLARLESIVLRLQGHVTDLRFPSSREGVPQAADPIDIEPFVD